MKKITLAMMALVIGASSIAIAAEPAINSSAIQQKMPKVHTNVQFQKVTVEKAKALADDSKVEIKGYVVKSLGKEKYQFRDSSGVITVEIDDDLWQGKPVSAKTLLTIQGEIDVDLKPTRTVEIDVDRVMF